MVESDNFAPDVDRKSLEVSQIALFHSLTTWQPCAAVLYCDMGISE